MRLRERIQVIKQEGMQQAVKEEGIRMAEMAANLMREEIGELSGQVKSSAARIQ